MAAETADIRTKTRRVKNHILNRFLAVADKVDVGKEVSGAEAQLYNELLMKFAVNVVPRSVEHGGDADNQTPIPILMTTNVPAHNGNQQNSAASETNPGSAGGNVSQ